MVSSLTGCQLHDHNCGFKVYRSEVLDEVGIYGELHRFVPVLAHARGFRVGEIVVNHRARQFGSSKYGVTRIIKGLLDLLTVRFLTRFSQRPLHVLGASAWPSSCSAGSGWSTWPSSGSLGDAADRSPAAPASTRQRCWSWGRSSSASASWPSWSRRTTSAPRTRTASPRPGSEPARTDSGRREIQRDRDERRLDVRWTRIARDGAGSAPGPTVRGPDRHRAWRRRRRSA